MPSDIDSSGGKKSNWAVKRHQSEATGRHYRIERELLFTFMFRLKFL